MVVTVSDREYEIGGIAYGKVPAWALIKTNGRQLTAEYFKKLPDADKHALVKYVQQHIAKLQAA